jgi:hypothetical protein
MVSPPAGSHPAAGRSGLVTFAGIMLLVAAAFNLLDGIVAPVNDDYYAVDELLFGDPPCGARGGCSSAPRC